MERLMLVLVGIVTMAFAALIVTGCVSGFTGWWGW